MLTAPALPVLAALALLVNAFIWGVSWWPFRYLQSLGVHPLWATALTYAVVVALIVGRRPQALRQLLAAPTLWVLALAAGCTNAAFNWAVSIGDVVRVVLLFYLMPLWSVLLARQVLAESSRTPMPARRAISSLTARGTWSTRSRDKNHAGICRLAGSAGRGTFAAG